MHAALGLLAAAVLGVDGTPAAEPPSITYQVKIAEVEGLRWRAEHHAKLTPVSRQGSASVWTAPKSVAEAVLSRAKVTASPRLTAFSEARATVSNVSTRMLETRATFSDASLRPLVGADGKPAKAGVVTVFAGGKPIKKTFEQASEGVVVNVAGRPLEQGVLARVTMNETEVSAVHPVGVEEAGPGGEMVKVSYEVPEFTGAKVVGEWLVPKDGVLVVSFGPRTTAGPDGKAVVREKLAFLEACPVAEDAALTLPALHGGDAPADDCPEIPMPVPVVPSRHLPQALNAEGIPLPPLPDDPEPELASPDSSDPTATPQSKKGKRRAMPVRDAESATASYRTEAPEPGRLVAAEREDKHKDEAPPEPKTFTFRIPLRAGVTLEVRATTAPTVHDAAPPPPLRPVDKD